MTSSVAAITTIIPALVLTAPMLTGGLDPHFGDGGAVVAQAAPGEAGDYQNGLALEPDGSIVVGGESDFGNTGGFQWRVARYTRNGLVDRTFAAGGTVLTNMSTVGGFDERLTSLAVQHDGKIVAGGWILTGPGTQDSALARYNVDGSLDASFGDGGVVVTDVASEPDHDFINQVLIDSVGRIVVAGGCRRMFVARYQVDGSLDTSFNASGPRPGLALTAVAQAGELNSEVLGLAFDGEGRIVGSGYSTVFDGASFKVSSAVVRFLPDGSLDPSLQPNGPHPGTVITNVAPDDGWNVAFRVAVDADGRIITAGDAFVGVGSGLYDVAVVRYLDDGTPDPSFGSGGIAFLNGGPGDSDDDAQGLAIEPDGAILVAGSAAPTAFTYDSDFMVARLRSDGTVDTAFGRSGIAITPTAAGSADDEIFAAVLQGGSKLVASGECDQPTSGRDVCIVRYSVQGVPAANR